MEKTVDMGLVKSIGISNFSSKKTDDWFGDARLQPAINQVQLAVMLGPSSSCMPRSLNTSCCQYP